MGTAPRRGARLGRRSLYSIAKSTKLRAASKYSRRAARKWSTNWSGGSWRKLDSTRPGNPPGGERIGINQIVWDAATHTVHFEVDRLLDQHRRYGVIVTKDLEARERVKARLEKALADGALPEARTRVDRFNFGPPVGYPVQFRVIGPDPLKVREIADGEWRATRVPGTSLGGA